MTHSISSRWEIPISFGRVPPAVFLFYRFNLLLQNRKNKILKRRTPCQANARHGVERSADAPARLMTARASGLGLCRIPVTLQIHSLTCGAREALVFAAGTLLRPFPTHVAVELSGLIAPARRRPAHAHAGRWLVELFHVGELYGLIGDPPQTIRMFAGVVPEVFLDLVTTALAVRPAQPLVVPLVPAAPLVSPTAAGCDEQGTDEEPQLL